MKKYNSYKIGIICGSFLDSGDHNYPSDNFEFETLSLYASLAAFWLKWPTRSHKFARFLYD